MKNYITIIIILIIGNIGYSQTKRGNIWYFGNRAGLDFNSGVPTPLLNSQMNTNEGCASIADRYGRLLFYTDGVKVWDACHQVMPNGDSLLGDPSSVTSAVITPVIGDSMRYYIFTVDGVSSCTNGLCRGPKGAFDGLHYSIVDMCLNNGKGDIVPGAKNIPMIDTTAEMIATIKHDNDTDYWIITQRLDAYYAYLVTAAGVSTTPVLSYQVHPGAAWPGGQRLVPSHDGKLLVHVGGSSPLLWGSTRVFNFDKTTGILTSKDTIARHMGCVAAEFSPNDSILYLGRMFAFGMMIRPKIMTYNRYAPNINASEDSIATPGPMDVPSDMRIGPDKKIYIKNSTSTTAVTVMHNPNNRTNPNIAWNSLTLGGRTMSSWLPNYFNYFDEDTSWVPANENLPYAGTNKSIDSCMVPVTLGIPYRDCHSYRWSPGASLNDSTIAQPNTLTAGTYYVTVTHKCDIYIDTVQVINNVNFTPVVINGNNIVCAGQQTSITASGGNGTNYSWSTGASTNTISVPAAGTYYYVTSVDGNCTSTDSVLISNSAPIIVNISGGGFVCKGNAVTLSGTASGGTGSNLSYLWMPGASTSQSINIVPNSPVQYILTITDSIGCNDTAMVVIDTLSSPHASLMLSNNVTCFGLNNGNAIISAAGGNGTSYNYLWFPGGNTNNAASNLSQGNYQVVVTDSAGCMDTVTVQINEPAILHAIVSSTLSNCGETNGVALATATGGSGTYTYSWSNGAVTNNCTGLAAGTYTLYLTDANNCSNDTVISISQLPPPTATVTANITIKQGENITLAANGGLTYKWYPANGLSCTNCANPVATPDSSQTYCVIVYDDGGLCSDTACVTITVESECSGVIFVPNAFSPNADGQNDVLFVKGDCIDKMQFSIFNRWGELIFESQTLNNGWNGAYKNRDAQQDVYVYKLIATTQNGEEILKQGNISLIK